MAHTFLWHDYETFGAQARYDRPAQFAAIRTDDQLNEIDRPLMEYCQLAPDYLPDPEACLITGITPQICQAKGVPEYEFAAKIEAMFSQSNTIGVGYNSIRFDDEFTRFLFWRNLIDPYAREWQNGCGRWDILDVVRTAYALRPDGIVWPQHEDGRISFKLEHLTAANGLIHEAAHDALSDVRATIGLAKLLRQYQPKLFEFCFGLRRKDRVLTEIGPLSSPSTRPLLHISGMFGVERGCLAVVYPLAQHPTNRNEIIVWDLMHDPDELPTLDVASLRLRLFTRAAELPEGMTRLPIKSIHINKSPIVINNLKTLSPALAERWGINWEKIEKHMQCASKLPDLSVTWQDVYARAYEAEVNVDADLYNGFISQSDRYKLAQLRALSEQDLARAQLNFDDDRLADLLWRYRARNFPQSLSPSEQAEWQAHCAARLNEGKENARTFTQFSTQLDTLQTTEKNRQVVNELRTYAQQLHIA